MRIVCFEDRSAPFVAAFRTSATEAGYDLTLAAPPPEDAAFRHFRSVYRHLSVNPEPFELACFRRYFAARTIVAPDERVIMADSDLIVQAGPRALPAEVMDFGRGMVGSVGVTAGTAETDISPHFSFWTGRLLGDFCDYLVHVYERQFDRLQAIHDARARNAARVAISDMTLLHLWTGDSGTPFLNANRVFGAVHIDHNVSMVDCANARFRSRWGRKALTHTQAGIGLTTSEGVPVRAAVLHLQGRYKLVATPLLAGSSLGVQRVSAYIAAGRFVRSLLAR